MLTTLRIKNLALVEDLTLELQPGFNAITGETGAGKSIILGALNLVLGERADRTLLRAGADTCAVEAAFDISRLRAPLKSWLEENGLEPCEEGVLLLKRVFSTAGANRQFVNGSPASLQTLAELGGWLVDVHGPHDHQSLLHPAQQLEVLDAFSGLEAARADMAERVARRAELARQKAALIVDEATYARQLDLLRFQTREIQAARLQPGEDEALQAEHQRASSAARRLELGQAALELLSGDEGLQTQAGALGRALQELERLDPAAAPLAAQQTQATALLRELQGDLSRYADQVDLDPARLHELEERLSLLQSLRRKYGGTVDQVITFGAEAARQLASLEQRDAELERLNAALQQADTALQRAARELSAQRRAAVVPLCQAANRQLRELGFRQSRLEIELAAGPVTATGLDTAEFQFAPNPGEPPRPLRAIASSGELARVMLALKTVLAAQDAIPVLVFDEVDANVGGETAAVVGEKMRQIARQRQVLCITHLAPVAAQAAAHYIVRKEVRGGRTLSHIERLADPRRVEELARMLGGAGPAARQHAEALLAAAR